MPPKVIKARNALSPAAANRRAEANTVPMVPVLSSTGQPLMPCHPARARELVRKGATHLALVVGYADKVGYTLSPITGAGRYIRDAKLDRMQILYRSSWLWQFPCSYKGYSSRGAYQRDVINAPSVVADCYQ